jgi:hypothetical protein
MITLGYTEPYEEHYLSKRILQGSFYPTIFLPFWQNTTTLPENHDLKRFGC